MWTLHKAIKEPNALTFAVTHNVDTRLKKSNKYIPTLLPPSTKLLQKPAPICPTEYVIGRWQQQKQAQTIPDALFGP